MASMSTVRVAKPFHLPSSLHGNGSWDRSCQYPWFSEFQFLYHDVENETLFT